MEQTVAHFDISVDGVIYPVREVYEGLNSIFYVTVLGRELKFQGDETGEFRPEHPYTIDSDLICAIGTEIENWCESQ